MKPIQQAIVSTALSYVGEKETKGNSGFQSREFLREMMQVGWQKGWAWCSVFAELVWVKSYEKNIQFPEKATEARKLITPSAVATWNNFKAKGLTSFTPVTGALVVWRYGQGWTGHIGIVIEVDLQKGTFKTVEGNTNAMGGREGEEVAIKIRKLKFDNSPKSLNLLGFVHPL